MTRNAFLLSGLALFFAASYPGIPFAIANVDSPIVQSLGGGGRSGIAREALFSNPAAVAQINNSFGFLHYSIPKIQDFSAGGRSYSAGLYDGGDKTWKGGFSYSRVSKAVLTRSNRQAYEDRSEIRFATGHALTSSILGGLQTRYIKKHSGPESSRFIEATAGAMFPLFSDIRAGLTWENILDREDNLPTTIGAGATYVLGYGVQLFGDGYRLMSGSRKGERGWSLAAEWAMSAGFLVRGGLFEEAYRNFKGWSVGGSWMGPRMSLDYAMRMTGKGPKEKEHVFGMVISF